MTILGCWFMTREIELSAIQRHDITVDHAARTISWYLPSQKNDTKAIGCTRTHGCCCKASRHNLCPFHTYTEHISLLQQTQPHLQSTDPRFPTNAGNCMTKDCVMQAVRAVAAAAGSRTTQQLPDGSIKQRFCGHVMRVAGAQALARASIPLNIIQLLGRWGSKAVERYVQDAPLAVSHRLALAVTTTLLPMQPAQQPSAAQHDHSDSDSSLPELLPMPDNTQAASIATPALRMHAGMHIVVNATSGTAHWSHDGPDAEPALCRTVCNWWFGNKHHFHDTHFARYTLCSNSACQLLFNTATEAI
jgi:hypothetical protein